MTVTIAVALLTRMGLVLLFLPCSLLDKVLGFRNARKQAEEVFRSVPLASAMILCGIGIELLMPLGILTGVADRLAAFIMAGYCAVTAVLFKRFWVHGDFWATGESKDRNQFWDFLKNFALACGFLFITVGTNGAGWLDFVAGPFGSTHPYTSEVSHG